MPPNRGRKRKEEGLTESNPGSDSETETALLPPLSPHRESKYVPAMSDSEAVSESQVDSSPAKKVRSKTRKRAKQERLDLLKEVEEQIVAWYHDNPMFYNKTHTDYCNRTRKAAAFQEKACELGMDVSDLTRWVVGMRDRAVKLFRKSEEQRSSDVDEEGTEDVMKLTNRDKWIAENFAFLREHMSRRGRKKPRFTRHPSVASRRPSAATRGPSATTRGLSAASRDSGAATQDPGAVTQDAGASTQDPGAATRGPSSTRQGAIDAGEISLLTSAISTASEVSTC